ncbi:hypothetical protein [Zoogloea dura]|uniref:Uncharacterized protein n=1 Tax=Zoogloea dura TaxID=2728840 RepID=A0A848FX46_9RHOO|nr:hypothetical protein [Zoogloea dura]NML24428.1 hypothetical protein [Zoogloea dura]
MRTPKDKKRMLQLRSIRYEQKFKINSRRSWLSGTNTERVVARTALIVVEDAFIHDLAKLRACDTSCGTTHQATQNGACECPDASTDRPERASHRTAYPCTLKCASSAADSTTEESSRSSHLLSTIQSPDLR